MVAEAAADAAMALSIFKYSRESLAPYKRAEHRVLGVARNDIRKKIRRVELRKEEEKKKK